MVYQHPRPISSPFLLDRAASERPSRARFLACLAALAWLLGGCADPGDEAGSAGRGEGVDEVFVDATLRGRAYLENKDSARSIEAFEAALARDSSQPAAWRNLARAQMLARESEAALASLGQALDRQDRQGRESAATQYLVGLVHARETRFDEALPFLEEAARLDPDSAPVQFQLASVLRSLGRHDEAAEPLRRTIALDPLHPTAHYWLSIYALQDGDRAEHEARQRDFTRSRELLGDDQRTPEALERSTHTRAETPDPAGQAPPPIEIRMALDSPEWSAPGDDPPAPLRPLATLGIDAEGQPSVLAMGGEIDDSGSRPQAGRLYRLGPPGTDAVALDARLPADRLEGRAVVGDYYDPWEREEPFDPRYHAHLDFAWVTTEGLHLFRGREDGDFDDVTAAAGLADAEGGTGATWADYDADGDLDLLVATAAGPVLWQNDGAGGFVDATERSGLATGQALDAIDLAAADTNGDVLLDLVLVSPGGTRVLENRRNGQLGARAEPGPWPAGNAVRLQDFDQDGRVDGVVLGADHLSVVRAGGEVERLELGPAAGPRRGDGLAVVDLDNDGWLDLVLADDDESGAGRLRFWRNVGCAWHERSMALGLDGLELPPIHRLLAADLDVDGDTDLLLDTAAGPRLLRNEGGHVNGQLKVRLVGTKTNIAGLGTQVEIRSGDVRSARRVESLPIELGLGLVANPGALDAVRVLWTNGIVDNQVGVEPGAGFAVVEIIEKNVAAGSCPFLYAWDGQGYRFVTDTLGNSPLGLSITRGVPLDADPDELVEIGPEALFPPREGRYVVQVTEEMREVLYLDSAWLLAVDHEAGTEVHSTDKLMPAPFPPSEAWTLDRLRAPRAARGSDGLDRTAAVARSDGQFAEPGVLRPPPLRGQTRPLELDLDFGFGREGGPAVERPWVLVLEGWLQYGDASTNIALSQGAAPVLPPILEVETSDGFQPVDVVVGMPAGKTKTILVNLEGKLPADARRLRLRTTMELRWDRIALGIRHEEAARHYVLEPITAELAWRGFSDIRSRAPGHPTTPEFDSVAARPPWTTALEGWVTAYGDVLPLVTERDGRLALVAAGDGLELHFDAAALPPLAEGFERTFFFGSVGWDKDGDANVIDGERVEPLPFEGAAPPDPAWQTEWNTRFVPRDRFERP